jgi:hypothetical protein
MAGINSKTKIMLHTANDIVDSSPIPNTFTNVGSTPFVSGTGFGAGFALSFNGAGTRSLTCPDFPGITLGSNLWGLDFRMNFTTHVADGNIVSQSTDGSNFWRFNWAPVNDAFNFILISSGAIASRFHGVFVPTNGVQYHVAMGWDGANPYVAVDGTQLSVVVDVPMVSIPDMTGLVRIGTQPVAGADPNASLQEIRFQVGEAPYAGGSFTPPTEPYSSDVTATTRRTLMGVGA